MRDRTARLPRRARRPGAPLLILERLLPDDGDALTMARVWDIHMLVNNGGGRERTTGKYRELLTRAGLTLRSVTPLSLDVHLLVAGPTISFTRVSDGEHSIDHVE